MEDPVIVWFLVGGAALVAVILGFAWKGASRRLQATAASLQQTQASLAKVEKKLEERRGAASEKQAEIETLKKKLGKAKKRTASAKQERSSEASHKQTLEEDLEAARETAKRLRDELTALQDAGAPPQTPARERLRDDKNGEAKTAPAPPRPPRPATDEALERMEQRASKAEAQALELRRKVSEAESELKRARGRSETNHRVYLITKGELEAVNDRLHTLQRHLGSASFRELLKDAGVAIGAKVAATVPLDPEAPVGVSAEQSLAADAKAAIEDQSETQPEEAS